MPTINERVLNGFIAAAMERLAPPGYTVDAEQSEAGKASGTAPDIVVHMPYDLRTIIETEYGAPAITDAKNRLGYEFTDSNIPMKSVIALGMSSELGGLEAHLIRLGTLRLNQFTIDKCSLIWLV